jgi:hypothetical protein
MLAILLIPFLGSVPLAVDDGRPRATNADTQPPHFEMAVSGVMDSALFHRYVTFRVELDRPFYVCRRFPAGESVELSGVLRAAKEGGFILEITIDGKRANDRRECDSFQENMAVGRKHLLCHGWVRWYEVNLVRAR